MLLNFDINVRDDKSLLEISLLPEHSPHGIFLAFGDYVNRYEFNVHFKINPWDVTPTILAFMNLPVPLSSDGRLLDIFSIDIRKRVQRRNYLSLWSALRRLSLFKERMKNSLLRR